jgi:hypothetical protein
MVSDFWVYDLAANGDLLRGERYSYSLMERIPGAVEVIAPFSAHLYASPDGFEARLGLGTHLTARFIPTAESCGILTLRHITNGDLPQDGGRPADSELVSLSVVMCGLHAEAEQLTLGALQTHLIRELHDTGFEPAVTLTQLPGRPAVATLNFASPGQPAVQRVAALADRCFAAAYFRYHHLA